MKQITDHIVEGDSVNHQLTIEVLDDPDASGACHAYAVQQPSQEGISGEATVILFQKGPIKECGVNGITQEALLAVVIDRLRGFQSGPFSCSENQIALDACRNALRMLQYRTRERISRGVEGTYQK